MFHYSSGETDSMYYDEHLSEIDERICRLIRERRKLCGGNPGKPGRSILQKWSKKYDIYESLLDVLFGELQDEEVFRPRVEPKGFRRFLPIMQGTEAGGSFFSVPLIRQYENASVLLFHVIRSDIGADEPEFPEYELEMTGYDCRQGEGSGSDGEYTMNYIISSALSDHYPEMDLVFAERACYPDRRMTGNIVTIHLKRAGK